MYRIFRIENGKPTPVGRKYTSWADALLAISRRREANPHKKYEIAKRVTTWEFSGETVAVPSGPG